MTATTAEDLWRCPVCRAGHEQPQARCRRCEADLLVFVRLELRARTATPDLARVLRGPDPSAHTP